MHSRTVIVVCVAIAVFGGLVGYYMYLTNHRYYIVNGDRSIAYEVDRVTGRTWMLRGATKEEHQNPAGADESLKPLPYFELAKVTGNAGLERGYFSGKVYNGSSRWIVKRLVFRITAKDKGDVDRWTRDVSDDITIPPLETKSVFVTVTGDDNIESSSWTIAAAYGFERE